MKYSTIILLILVSINSLSAQSERDLAMKYLENNSFATSYKGSVSVETFEEGKPDSLISFDLFVNEQREILKYTNPPRDRGKVILQMEGRYWLYFPSTGRSIVLAPLGVLAGGVSNGDLLKPPFMDLYEVDKKSNLENGISLTLKAIKREAPYGSIQMEFSEGKIIKASYYSRSGILLKQAEYENHIMGEWGTWIPSEVLIRSPLNKGVTSVIRLGELIEEEITDQWFNPNNLKRVR